MLPPEYYEIHAKIRDYYTANPQHETKIPGLFVVLVLIIAAVVTVVAVT